MEDQSGAWSGLNCDIHKAPQFGQKTGYNSFNYLFLTASYRQTLTAVLQSRAVTVEWADVLESLEFDVALEACELSGQQYPVFRHSVAGRLRSMSCRRSI